MTHLDVLEPDELSSATAPGLWSLKVLVHSDHCAKKLLPWFDGMLEADEVPGDVSVGPFFFFGFLGGLTKMGKHPGCYFFFGGGLGGVLCGCVGVDVSRKNSETRIWKRFHGLRLFPCRLKHPSVTHFLTSVSYLIISSMSLPAVKGIVATAFYALVLRLLKPTECSDVMWGAVKKTTVPWVQRPLECEAQISSGLFFKTGMDGRHGRWSIVFFVPQMDDKISPKKMDLATSILAWPG